MFLWSSEYAGHRGHVDSGNSFASESPELSLCSVGRLHVGKNPNENQTGMDTGGSWLNSHG